METGVAPGGESTGTGAEQIRRRPFRLTKRLRLPVEKAVSALVADRQAIADTIVDAPTPWQPINLADDAQVAEVLDLAVRVGEVVLASGTSVGDTTTQIQFIAATYGLARCDVDVTYDSIRIWADRGAALPPASSMRVVRYRSMDFTRLAAVDRLTRRLRAQFVTPEEARAALDAIVKAPHPYHRWTATLAWSLLAAAVSALLGGGVLVCIVSLLTTAVIDRIGRLLNRYNLPFFFQHMVGGAIAAAPALVLSALAGKLGIDVNPTLVVAAGITVLLSGLSLVGSVQDAINGAPVTAAARLLEVIMMTGGIIAGIALTLQIGERFNTTVAPIDMTMTGAITDLPVKIIAGAIAAFAYAFACYAERRALTAAAVSGAAGAICFLLVQHMHFGVVVSSGVAATVVGLAGGLMARRALTPPLVVAVAGITPLLPGLSVYRGLYAMLNSNLPLGANQLLAAFGIGCALAAGVTLGEWFDRTIRRPRILRRFGQLRRPIVLRRPARRPLVDLVRRPRIDLVRRPRIDLVRRPRPEPRRATRIAGPAAPVTAERSRQHRANGTRPRGDG